MTQTQDRFTLPWNLVHTDRYLPYKLMKLLYTNRFPFGQEPVAS